MILRSYIDQLSCLPYPTSSRLGNAPWSPRNLAAWSTKLKSVWETSDRMIFSSNRTTSTRWWWTIGVQLCLLWRVRDVELPEPPTHHRRHSNISSQTRNGSTSDSQTDTASMIPTSQVASWLLSEPCPNWSRLGLHLTACKMCLPMKRWWNKPVRLWNIPSCTWRAI